MSDLQISTYLLYEKANKVLDYENLHPRCTIEIIKDFLCYKGCKSRNDYETMVRYLFANDGYNREKLLNN